MWDRQESRRKVDLPHGDFATFPEGLLQLLLVRDLHDHPGGRAGGAGRQGGDATQQLRGSGIAQLVAAMGVVLVLLLLNIGVMEFV